MVHSTIPNALALGLIASLAAPTQAFWRMPCPSRLLQERADPIVSPDHVSAHVHTIAGGNGFGFTMNYTQARESPCSSCPIKQDLSNYWTPVLYYRAENGSFVSVPQVGDGNGTTGGMIVYYQQRGPDDEKLYAFPEDFRMVAGNPLQRNYTGDLAAQAVSFACLDYSGGPTTQTKELPNKNCPNGVRAQIYFPSCWDGTNLDSPDHRSHMSYPVGGSYDNGRCPASHPVHLISLFYEVLYQTNLFADDWYGNSQPFVFSNGDPTGYGFHGDFVNGWDIGTLQSAVDNCKAASGLIADCSFFDFFTDAECQRCSIPSSIDEDITGPMPALPGCNPVQNGPDTAVNYAATCNITSASSTVPTYFTDLTMSKQWEYIGCGTDNDLTRTFNGPTQHNDTETVEQCVDFCAAQGYMYAGLEYSTQCYCDNSLATDRAPVPGVLGQCTMKCGGDDNQYCGGANALSIYKKCDASGCQNAQYTPVGDTTFTKRHLDEHRRDRRHAVAAGSVLVAVE